MRSVFGPVFIPASALLLTCSAVVLAQGAGAAGAAVAGGDPTQIVLQGGFGSLAAYLVVWMTRTLSDGLKAQRETLELVKQAVENNTLAIDRLERRLVK